MKNILVPCHLSLWVSSDLMLCTVPQLPQESMGKCCVQQIDADPTRPPLLFQINSAKKVCQKSICNCFHSCVFMMGSLIILHVIYETVPVFFRLRRSQLTSVLQRCIDQGPDARSAPRVQIPAQVTSLETQTLH